jgi:phage repressor protein C with HTH and peptisase S24 domain
VFNIDSLDTKLSMSSLDNHPIMSRIEVQTSQFLESKMDDARERVAIKIRNIRDKLKLSQTEFAELVGITQKKVSRLELGQIKLDLATAERLSLKLGLKEDWLEDLPVKKPAKADKPARRRYKRVPKETFSIPIYDAYASAGPGLTTAFPEQIGSFPFQEAWFERTFSRYPLDKLGMIRVEGDSMNPTIGNGDYCLFVFDGRFRADGVYLIQLYDSLYVKRLQRIVGGSVKMISDNPAYEDQVVTGEDETGFRLVGSVLWISRVLG